jgi:hypothetical protein
MRPSELIRSVQPASFADKDNARLIGVSDDGRDLALPYIQAGWVNVADGQYTQAAPLSFPAGVKTQITINGLGATTNKEYANGMSADVWSDDKFKPSAIGEVYNLRLTGIITSLSSATGTYATFDADIGTDEAPFIAASQSIPLIKGQGVPTIFTVSAPFFTLATFGVNGARLFLTSSVDVVAYNFAIFIQRTFKP